MVCGGDVMGVVVVACLTNNFVEGNTGRLQAEQLAHLPAFANYQFVYVPAMTYLNLNSRLDFHNDEGLAIFSKYPILNTTAKILSRNVVDKRTYFRLFNCIYFYCYFVLFLLYFSGIVLFVSFLSVIYSLFCVLIFICRG